MSQPLRSTQEVRAPRQAILRLYRGPEAGPERVAPPQSPARRTRLSEAFERQYLPARLRARGGKLDPKTLQEDRAAIRAAGDPFVDELSEAWCNGELDEDSLTWSAGLAERLRDGRADQTVAKILRHLAPIVRHVALEPFRLRIPRPENRPPDDGYSLAEIAALEQACGEMPAHRRLREIPPGLFWHSLVTFVHNTGCRIGETMALAWSGWGELWGGWLTIPREIRKGQIQSHWIYLNRSALAAIEALRAYSVDGLIFPWEGGYRDGTARSQLCAQFRRLAKLAGIRRKPGQNFHPIRDWLSTWLKRHYPGLEPAIIGHDIRLADRNYLQWRTEIPAVMESIPQRPGEQAEQAEPKRKKPACDPRQLFLL